MSTGLVFVHGRAQQLPRAVRGDPAAVGKHVRRLRQEWLAGLAQGLVLAGSPPITEDRADYPFYGDALAGIVEADQEGGGRAPDLEFAGTPVRGLRDSLVVDAARSIGFDPREVLHAGPEAAARVRSDEAEELALTDLLGLDGVHAALDFLARKTGTAGRLIELFLADVAYYLGLPEARRAVQDVVLAGVERARDRHEAVVLVAHSLGTVVAHDLLARPELPRPVRLLVTLGSPLGLPVVRSKLHAGSVPSIDAVGPPQWVNAYDVRDPVALVHPLGPEFDGGDSVRDIVVHNPSDPHSVRDYLSDRDVAAAIERAL